MRVSKKQSPRANLLKSQKLSDKPRAASNKPEQVRKILGKHYASKYRVR